MAVQTLEEAGSTYYYSTRSDEQQVNLVHGVRLTGSMVAAQMADCCREHDIRLIVDAAHPFAEELHRNLLSVASQAGIPVIRYDRIYPTRNEAYVWCRNYDEAISRLEEQRVTRLLALTGVNTIGKLRPYWERHEACWFRILNRKTSLHLAKANGFPEERLVYDHRLLPCEAPTGPQDTQGVEEDERTADGTLALIRLLHPQAVITKESGLSGGFCEKAEAARRAGVKVFVIERPQYPSLTAHAQKATIELVNGPYGLRRAVEHLLPEFFPLHSGLTTGTCATAAAVAAGLQFKNQAGIQKHGDLSATLPQAVPVVLPNGETISVPVSYSEGYASCFKEAGDDPDVTDGLEIRAAVARMTEKVAEGGNEEDGNDGYNGKDGSEPHGKDGSEPHGHITILGGEGVGRFTLPGFDYPPGEPAINKAPREMIRHNLQPVMKEMGALSVTISVPRGAEIAKRTFNPRLGIEGGISIIGVSGIVKPFSEEAFIDSIRKCMEVAKASGSPRVVLNSGGKSERVVRSLYPDLPQQAFVQYGNSIDAALRKADELGIGMVTLCVMLGKAVKLADGHLDTHSRRAVMNKPFIASMMSEAGCRATTVEAFLSPQVTLARDLWNIIPADVQPAFCSVVINRCYTHCRPLLPKGRLTILLVGEDGTIQH